MPLPPNATNTRRTSPWKLGWAAARANLVPGLVLQMAAALLLVAYHSNDAVAEQLNALAQFKKRSGLAYAAASGMLFCGLIPWLFRMAVASLRPARPASDLVFGIFWWAGMAMLTDTFYQIQAATWGDATSTRTVFAKVACDMLVFTPLLAAPFNAMAHAWKALGFSLGATRAELRGKWYRRIVLPNLVPNWMLWTPGMAIVYSLPTLLQLPVANLIGCFWALLCTSIAADGRTEGTKS